MSGYAGSKLKVASALLVAATVLFVGLDGNERTVAAEEGQSIAAVGAGDTRLGVYDPGGAFAPSSKITIEHIYLPLFGVDLDSLESAGSYSAARGREMLITVEPWRWGIGWDLSSDEFAAALSSGDTDEDIVGVCETVAELPGPVMLRWGHEMETKMGRYAWAQMEPHNYIAAYRHFVTLCRKYAPSAQFVWSPLGLPDLVRFYPGDDVVDIVGVTVFALQQYERDLHGWDRNVNDIAEERFAIVEQYEKPLLIAELGCFGDEEYVELCLRQMLALDAKYPELRGVVYFNDQEPASWPGGYGKPDWRLPSGAFATVN